MKPLHKLRAGRPPHIPARAGGSASTATQRAFGDLLQRRTLLCRCEGTGPLVALTFDDGPSPVTDQVLQILARQRTRATFFVIGRRVVTFRKQLRAIRAAGHQVENHTWSHELGRPYTRGCFATSDSDHQRREIERTDQVLGTRARYLRVPGGLFNTRAPVLGTAAALGKIIVDWDVSGDTPGIRYILHGRITGKTSNDVLRHYLHSVRPGSIVLLHPENRYDAPYSLSILEALIVGLKRRGYRLVTLDELVLAGHRSSRRKRSGESPQRLSAGS